MRNDLYEFPGGETGRKPLEEPIENWSFSKRWLRHDGEPKAEKDQILLQTKTDTPSPHPMSTLPPRILLIDDDRALRDVVAKSLAYAGHTVTQAEDGLQGIELARVATFDLVITDLVMPVKEGLETILALRQEFPALPVIAISGGLDNSTIYLDVAAKIGAKRILGKPFTPGELIKLIEEVLRET